MKIELKKSLVLPIVFSLLSTFSLNSKVNSPFSATAESKGSDWVSENTVASVVKLSSYYKVYEIEGLPEDYEYTETDEMPDFKGGRVIREVPFFMHVGTGVIVTKTGLIISNAHVTSACKTPLIEDKLNPQGNVVLGSDGKPIRYVEVPTLPNQMFVEMADVAKLKKNDDAVCNTFIAKILIEDTFYENQIRDRAILQITDRIIVQENGEPAVDNINKLPKAFPFAVLDNPFKASYLDNKVKAMGFPAVGDPNRAAKTSGELMGYESSSTSKILHSSWISGGNSGGGLFYNDKLIGINTWDNQSNPVRPLGIAQPITWWGDIFVHAKWLYPEITLPEFSHEWALSDPSTETYKNMSYVKIKVNYKSNPNEVVNKGKMLLYKNDWELQDIIDFRQYEQFFNTCWQIAQVLWNNTVQDTANYFGVSEEFAGQLVSVTNLSEMRERMDRSNETLLKYFDIWQRGDFVYSLYDFIDDGKIILTVNKNCKYELCYVDENGDVKDSYHLTCDKKCEQGPYTFWLY